MKRFLPVLFVLILVVPCAKAWNRLGHQAVAQQVWRQMNSGQRQAAADLLRAHPHYTNLLTADVPAGVDTNEWAFLTAAVWPDRVRPAKPGQPPKPQSVTKYNVYPHGVELPFVRPGDSTRDLLEQYPAVKPTAQFALADSIATLKNSQASAHDRAVALGWVLHLVADLHQPLHCANLVTKDRVRDLSAGGRFLVRNGDSRPVSLHAFWDGLPGADVSYRGVTALADELARAPELQPATLKEYRENRTIASWIQESHRIAVDFAYAADRVKFVSADAVESGKIPATAVPAVTADYVDEARTIARRRLALAALRLADVLPQQ
jgi:hypothetical protein